ncbi:MAG: hypothetical protein ACLSFZ_09735 [Frisingicoccus sp.]
MPFAEISSDEEVAGFIRQCVEKEQIPAFWEELIPAEKVFAFCRSELGRGWLGRKNPESYTGSGLLLWEFLCRNLSGTGCGETSDTSNFLRWRNRSVTSERILIQGVIDVYFEEDDGVVLLDYKTDRIPKGEAGDKILIKRYKTQLDYYQKAIEQISGKKVKDRILYSVIMNREIHC